MKQIGTAAYIDPQNAMFLAYRNKAQALISKFRIQARIIPRIDSKIFTSENLTSRLYIQLIILACHRASFCMINKRIATNHQAIAQTAISKGKIVVRKIIIKSMIQFVQLSQR